MRNTPSYDNENLPNISLPKWLELIQNISDKDFEYIQEIIKSTDLSSYLLDIKDFFVIKNNNWEIASFGRMLNIWENSKEICSVWVDPKRRWNKLWLYLCQELIKQKKWNCDIFLATKTALEQYYSHLGFSTIHNNIPEKLVYTGIWAEEHGIEFVIMKYCG